MKCLSLTGCDMAVSQSWASYHTSSERGESELCADENLFEFFHTNSHYQAYFWVVSALIKVRLHFGLLLSHFLLDIQLPYPQLKRIPRASIWPQFLEYQSSCFLHKKCYELLKVEPLLLASRVEEMQGGWQPRAEGRERRGLRRQ